MLRANKITAQSTLWFSWKLCTAACGDWAIYDQVQHLKTGILALHFLYISAFGVDPTSLSWFRYSKGRYGQDSYTQAQWYWRIFFYKCVVDDKTLDRVDLNYIEHRIVSVFQVFVFLKIIIPFPKRIINKILHGSSSFQDRAGLLMKRVSWNISVWLRQI